MLNKLISSYYAALFYIVLGKRDTGFRWVNKDDKKTCIVLIDWTFDSQAEISKKNIYFKMFNIL